MAKKSGRILIGLACEDCRSVNYVVSKNKLKKTDPLVLKKFCQKCRAYKTHRETKKLD
ncbi:MAG: 50S ribosomal protein L33 [Patescibacteria group bacterium]|nr:50S ribosomal protein L33 [Patescibacteria group bacterium]